MTQGDRYQVIEQLKKEVRSLEGYKRRLAVSPDRTGLGPLEAAFPDHKFPTGTVHEFLSHAREGAAATNGFIAGLLGSLIQGQGLCLWISDKRTVFPPALKLFGMEPDRVIFLDVSRNKEALWAIEEALKCEGLAAVVGELSGLSFTESRRLQLAVEHSQVTGLLHRYYARHINTVACAARWRITPVPCEAIEGMPGVGLPRWNVELLKVRNGKPGSWQFEWAGDGFRCLSGKTLSIPSFHQLKTG